MGCIDFQIDYRLLASEMIDSEYNLSASKKVRSDSPGLAHVAIGLVNSVLNLPNRKMKLFEKFHAG